MLSPPSFILPIIVERLILGGLWFHIKLDRDLFTWSTKLVRTLRTEEMKLTFERAKLLIMVIFPKGIKSLEDQTLRHFSRATNFFSKLSFLKLLHHMRFISHELSWQRGVVFFSKLFSLDCWYRVSLALGPGALTLSPKDSTENNWHALKPPIKIFYTFVLKKKFFLPGKIFREKLKTHFENLRQAFGEI